MTKKGLTVEEVENIVNDAGEEITSPLYIGKRVGDDRDVLLDLDKLGSSLVTGGCGTGKTWFLMNVVANLIHFNEADEIDVRISSYGEVERYQDFRDSEKVTSFVGGDIRKFLTEIENLHIETLNRVSELESTGVLKERKTIYFIFDESLITLETVEAELGKEKRGEVENKIKDIVAKGRKVDIKAVIASQRLKGFNEELGLSDAITWGYVTKTVVDEDWNMLFGGNGDKYSRDLELGTGYFKCVEGKNRGIELVRSNVLGLK